MIDESPGWRLEGVTEADRAVLMRWFGDESSVRIWGGPAFRYPFTEASFREDALWDSLAGFALRDPAGRLAAFGQIYDHLGRIHLARLVVEPGRRGGGVGRRLILALLEAGHQRWPYDEASLYVYRDNEPALACYRSLGFRAVEFPAVRAELAGSCYFLTRPLDLSRSTATTP
jgi:ribosomal protein S18 acetylase RimI-like enzyme